MGEAPVPVPFSWYTERSPQALPPKSLAIIPGLLLVGMSLPMAGLHLLGHALAVKWIAAMALLVMLALLVDVLSTYRKYQDWVRQSLCAECRQPYTANSVDGIEHKDIDPGHFPLSGEAL